MRFLVSASPALVHAAGLLAMSLLLIACETDSRTDSGFLDDAPEPRVTEVAEARLDVVPDSSEAEGFEETMAFARENELHERPIGVIMQRVGERFLGEPYVVGPLDGTDEEVLVCRLDGFDCYTFVDAMLALARTIKDQDYSYQTYAGYTMDQRYRGGKMDDYCSRLHYFSDWIADNESRGNVRNITEDLGGERIEKTLNFMSENRQEYPRFAENDVMYECIQEMEGGLTDMVHFYIPQHRIGDVYNELQAGDILAFTTDIGGLDVSHTGLVYEYEDGRKGVLHASIQGEVLLSSDVQTYVQNVERQIGIVVTRPHS